MRRHTSCTVDRHHGNDLLTQSLSRRPAKEATAGFPSHPHRGFETCSIMITGKMQHKDSYGNEGVISDGGVQVLAPRPADAV